MTTPIRRTPFIPQRVEIPELFSAVALEMESISGSDSKKISKLLSSFRQFLAIQEQLSRTDSLGSPGINPVEISELGEYGLTLLYELSGFADELQQQGILQQIQTIVLGTTEWIISKSGRIARPEPVVDALAAITNRSRDKTELEQLANFMGRVSIACADTIKHDLDLTNPGRPWRLLQINRGIAATRSHNTEVMAKVFEDLVVAIPYDAPDFFIEGMREMEALSYPDFVRSVIQEYHERFSHPRSH